MVGPILLAAILHCTKHRKKLKLRNYTGEGTCLEENPEADMKMEINEDITCRVCLKYGNIPIYGNDRSDDISEALNTIAGIEVRNDDAYPKSLCQSCNSLLLSAIEFRKTAQQSEILLTQPSQEKLDVYDDSLDIQDDNLHEYIDTKVKKEQRHHCRKCEISFDSIEDYNVHRMSEEHDNMRHTCPICNKSYAALYYKKHMTLHQGGFPYMCDICGKKFIMQGHFTRHRVTHFYKLPFKCSLCPYKGRFSESLKMHMRSHTGEKPYQCTQCPGRFINKSNLNKHMLTHKAEHDFQCDSCGRGFYTKRELELHYKVDHTGIKDHICNLCGKAFGYRKQMMKHQLKVHKREKLKSGRMPLYLKVETMKQQGQKINIEA